MDKDEILRHQEQRKQLWIDAWVKVAGASNCVNKTTATSWADKALEEFDNRFKQPIKEKQNETIY
jgi:hypothetical protein